MAYGDQLGTRGDNKEWSLSTYVSESDQHGVGGIASDGRYFYVVVGSTTSNRGSVLVFDQYDKSRVEGKDFSTVVDEPAGAALNPETGVLYILDTEGTTDNLKRYSVAEGATYGNALASRNLQRPANIPGQSGAFAEGGLGGGFNASGQFRIWVSWIHSRLQNRINIWYYTDAGGNRVGIALSESTLQANDSFRVYGIALTPTLAFLVHRNTNNAWPRHVAIRVFERTSPNNYRSDLRITVDASNAVGPSGIWTDGVTLWLADRAGRSIKAWDVVHEGPTEEVIFDIVREMLLGSQWINVEDNENMNRIRISRKS